MTKKINLSEDAILLISNIRFREMPDMESKEVMESEQVVLAIDMNNIYGGNFLFESISWILGKYDQHLEGTEFNPDGPRFSQELEDYMYELHTNIIDNLGDIEEILHQFAAEGLKPGTYMARNYEGGSHIWEFKN